MENQSAIDLVVQFGYVTLFLIVMVENIEFFGSFPTSVIAAAMGAVAAQGLFDPVVSIIVLTVASVAGDVIGYYLGIRFGRPLLEKWGKQFIAKNNRLERVEGLVKKYGIFTVFFSRFVLASLQAIINIIAGISRMRFIPFLIAATLGELIWSLLYFWLGYFAWDSLQVFFSKIVSFGLVGGILTIAGVALVVFIIVQIRKRILAKV